MGEVLKLPRRKNSARKTTKEKLLRHIAIEPHLQDVLLALYDIDKRRARKVGQTFQKLIHRLETLEAVVFAQSILIAELRGQPLTLEQQSKIASLLRAK